MGDQAYLNESLTFEERAKALVAEMTLEEKVFQTLHGAKEIKRLGVKAYNYWNEALHGVARAGVATVFPQAIGLAAIFDEDFMEEIADVISTEGRAKFNVEALMKFNAYENIEVFYDVANMPELMTSCDIGITSRGRTGYELALLGIPSIAMAQNKREEKHGFVCNENGFSYIGLNPEDEIIESNLKMYLNLSKKARQNFQDKLLSHDLCSGRRRVMGLINNL